MNTKVKPSKIQKSKTGRILFWKPIESRGFYGHLIPGSYCGHCEEPVNKRDAEKDECSYCGKEFTGKKYNCKKPECTNNEVIHFETVAGTSINCRACFEEF